MGRVSKIRLSHEREDLLLQYFASALTDIRNKNLLIRFLSAFLTPEEKLMLAKRLAAIFLLEKGAHYRDICRDLILSTATINAYQKNILAEHTKVFGEIFTELEKVIEKEDIRAETRAQLKEWGRKTDKFFQFLELLIESKWSGKARTKLMRSVLR